MFFSSLLLKTAFFVFVAAFLVNLFWEVSHSVLYNWNAPPLQDTVAYYVPRILRSTFGDALMISFIFFLNSARHFGAQWISRPNKWDYAAFVLLGLLFAIIIEVRAMIEGRWAYGADMPLIFGIGLTPLVQLAITGILAVLIVGALL